MRSEIRRGKVLRTGLALRLVITGALVLALVPSAYAWGPHPRITAAAIEVLGPDAPLRRVLGREADLLPTYSWLADWRRSLVSQAGGRAFLADDYLLFPGSPRHVGHECPDVEATYRPFFRRAVQALRTETPENAARWVGALLHFVEDSGSPPHAFRTGGTLHTRMENWVNANQIQLGDYRPRLLGETEAEATDGFVRRMDGLIAYSRQRGEQVRPMAEAGRRAEAEPLILESALETSRVVADVLHTLGRLSGAHATGTAALRGRVTSRPPAGAEGYPAKVVLDGTNFSTLASADGTYTFRNLPAGNYRLVVIRAGSEPSVRMVTLADDRPAVEDVALDATDPPGNLIRDPRLGRHWLNGPGPDGWHRDRKRDGSVTWQSDPLPAEGGAEYRLAIRWKPGARGSASVLWHRERSQTYDGGVRVDHYYSTKVASETFRSPPDGAGNWTLGAPEGARYAVVVLEGQGVPDESCERVDFGRVRDPLDARKSAGTRPELPSATLPNSHPGLAGASESFAQDGGTMRLTCLEIPDYGRGAGLAVVIETPGGKTYLYDTGSGYPANDGKGWAGGYNAGRDAVLPFLEKRGIQGIDGVLISHGHYDHFGGLMWLVDHVKIPKLIDSGYTLPGSTNGELADYEALRGRFRKTPGAYLAAHAGDRLDLDPALAVEVIAPPKSFFKANPKRDSQGDSPDHYLPNANSLGVRITHGAVSFLLPGDIQTLDQEELLLPSVAPETLRCDVLVAPAHGIQASPAFARVVSPKVTIVSAGGRYARSSQSPRVFSEVGSRVFVTGFHGQVSVTSDGKSFTLDVERPAAKVDVSNGGK